MTGFNANFNIDYKNAEGVSVATGYANLASDGITINVNIKDRKAYEADKDNISAQETAFRAQVMQIADIMGIATVEPKEA